MTIDRLITQFLEYLEIERGRSNQTVKNYDHYLRMFSSFARENKVLQIDQIDQDLLRKYRLYLNRLPSSISKKTQNYYLIALRSFFKYLAKIDIKVIAPEKIELAKNDERAVTFLNEDELEDLFSQIDTSTIQGKRDYAILNLLFSTGLRVSELCSLKINDINLDKDEFSIKGKGGKIRVVFIDENAKLALDKYLRVRNDKSPYLFIGYGHTSGDEKIIVGSEEIEALTPRSVQRLIKKHALSAGITKQVTPHVLRHSFATDLLMSGADLRAVQTLLGHSSVTTTQIYTHITDQHLKDVHKAFHGLRNTKKDK